MQERFYEKWNWDNFFQKVYKINKHILLVGGTGAGKTTWLINFYKHCPHRVLFFNSIGHIAIEKSSDIVTNNIGDVKNILDKELLLKRICFTPDDNVIYNIDLIMKQWNIICGLAYSHEDVVYTEYMTRKGLVKNRDFRKKSNMVLINDELMYVCDNEYLMPYHYGCMTRGRNYAISMVGATQRNQNISKIITSQTFYKILFSLEYYDTHALRTKIPHVEDCLSLADYHFIFIRGRNVIYYSPIAEIKELEV